LNGSIALENLDPGVQTVVDTTSVMAVERGSPAAAALRAHDHIVAADGVPASVRAVRARIDSHRCARALVDGCMAATPVLLTVRRHGRTVTASAYPHYSARAKRMLLGFVFGAAPKPFGVAGAARASLGQMWHVTKQTLTGFGHALTSERARKQVS